MGFSDAIFTPPSICAPLTELRHTLTSIGVGLGPVPILETVIPRALVLCPAAGADSDPVPAFEAVCPFPSVNPVSFGFYSQAVALPLRPVALECVPAGPGVDAHHLEAVVPGSGELSLALRSGADAVAVRFASLPASAVRTAIVELEPTPAHASD